jgi:epoxyqueuosine reductase
MLRPPWGTAASPEAVPVLTAALSDDEPLIRGHAAWALGRVGTPDASVALRSRERVEGNEWVREEIALAGASSDYPSPDGRLE